MIDVRQNEFGKKVARNLAPILVSLVQNSELFYRIHHDTDLIFESKINYKNRYYIVKIDNRITVSRQSKYDKDVLDDIFATPALFNKASPVTQKDYEMVVEYVFFINDTEAFAEFFSDMNIDDIKPYYYLMDSATQLYNDLMLMDLESIFKCSQRFSKSINLFSGTQYIHKHIIDNKETLTFVDTSRVVEEFIIYEKNPDNGHINVYRELVANIDPNVFKMNTIVVSKYKNLIEHCIKTLVPKLIVKDKKIIKNSDSTIIKVTDDLAIDLNNKYKIVTQTVFDKSHLPTIMDYLSYDNINLLYGYALWSSGRGKWVKGKRGFYIVFSDSDVLRVKRMTPMQINSNNLGYIASTSENCVMSNIPEGVIDPDWCELVRKSYWFMYHNYDKIPVCDVDELLLDKVGHQLERLSII